MEARTVINQPAETVWKAITKLSYEEFTDTALYAECKGDGKVTGTGGVINFKNGNRYTEEPVKVILKALDIGWGRSATCLISAERQFTIEDIDVNSCILVHSLRVDGLVTYFVSLDDVFVKVEVFNNDLKMHLEDRSTQYSEKILTLLHTRTRNRLM